MPNDYSPNSPSRRKAKTLNAQDAEVLIISTLANVRSCLTQKQINQVQKVLDAAVVNPAVKKEAEGLARRSVTHRAGSLAMHDPRIERQVDKANEGLIWVHEQDKHIRLDFEKLLAANALEPVTDNPDEAEYMKKVKNTLEEKGVWLRVGQERASDPRSFVVWLSLGYDGDVIPAGIGILDREAILGNQLLGANYRKKVTEGTVQKELESQIYRMEMDIDDGEKEHERLIRRYEDAFPGVAELSDAIGGADLPGRSIWVYSKGLMSKARDLNKGGRVMASQICLLLAALAIDEATKLLSTYAERSSEGAASIVKVLEVAATAGQIATDALMIVGIYLSVTGIAGGVLRRPLKDVAKDVATKWKPMTPGEEAFARELKQMRYPLLEGKGKTVLSSGTKAGQSSGIGKPGEWY